MKIQSRVIVAGLCMLIIQQICDECSITKWNLSFKSQLLVVVLYRNTIL